jgi:hypothetical protein
MSDWENAKFVVKFIGVLLLSTVTAGVIFVTPLAYLYIKACEAFAWNGDRLYYHWLALVPLSVLLLIWLLIGCAFYVDLRKQRAKRAFEVLANLPDDFLLAAWRDAWPQKRKNL